MTKDFKFEQYRLLDDPLAQLAEHLPFKERVLGSSPRRVTINRSLRLAVRMSPFHGEDTGSIPVGNAICVT